LKTVPGRIADFTEQEKAEFERLSVNFERLEKAVNTYVLHIKN
jgi:hypothetical protein